MLKFGNSEFCEAAHLNNKFEIDSTEQPEMIVRFVKKHLKPINMNISVEISMYPLDDNYNQKVMNFVNNLYSFEKIESNHMSTMILREYDNVMNYLNKSMKQSFEELQSSMVFKISNGCKVE